MSMSVFQIGLLTAGVVFLLGGAALAVIASRIAAAGRAAQIEADIRLAASQELAVEVKRLAEKVEQSLVARDAAIENAFLRHNDACMASVQSSLASTGGAGCGHVDPARATLSDHDDDDDDDDHHKKGHAAKTGDLARANETADSRRLADDDEHDRPSFLARLFRRYP